MELTAFTSALPAPGQLQLLLGLTCYNREGLKDRPEVLALFNRVPDFIREQHMRRLRHQGTVSIYEWQPKK